ncbi:MAG: FTR1 family protein [Proteobacteria bacterium]|nr:FTR1 family protein [Pseudomonadota bacterium]
MLLTSVILVLREVLEAAMLVSVLLALSRHWQQSINWLWWSLPVGLVGAIVFASLLDVVTDAFDGAGQELANALLQGLLYCLILTIVVLSPSNASHKRLMSFLMAAVLSCAMIREGSEILIYVVGFASAGEHAAAVYAGSVIGAGIGVSLGVLLYSALRALSDDRIQATSMVLISLMGVGTIMQATLLLEQVDWLPAGRALWDSSWIVSEQSIAGQLLYAVFGYEATPSVLQIVLYTVCLSVMFGAHYFSVMRWGNLNEA